jgi:hypothetical protein
VRIDIIVSAKSRHLYETAGQGVIVFLCAKRTKNAWRNKLGIPASDSISPTHPWGMEKIAN